MTYCRSSGSSSRAWAANAAQNDKVTTALDSALKVLLYVSIGGPIRVPPHLQTLTGAIRPFVRRFSRRRRRILRCGARFSFAFAGAVLWRAAAKTLGRARFR